MPTPESAAAFAKLVEKRARLNEVSRELRNALENRAIISGDRRYQELQAQWDQALRDMELATEEFSAIIKRLHDKAGSGNA
jgi:hypothetical protein